MRLRWPAAIAGAVVVLACERHDVDVELPRSGRSLSRVERAELQRIADTPFRDVRAQLDGLPPRLTLIVRWGKDVIPETGENGAAGYPGKVKEIGIDAAVEWQNSPVY